ncbi:MAG: GNAT family N-acetyltransferase [Candidatus Lokiarchaeota archaeon]
MENKAFFKSRWEHFEKELENRVLKLQDRNSMVVAREAGKMIGWGTYTIWRDYLGKDWAVIHQILTKREDSYKKGIEERIIKELQSYIKRTLKIEKTYYICPDSNSALRSIFLKLGIKKSDYIWYEYDYKI